MSINELIPNEKYQIYISMGRGRRLRQTFHGTHAEAVAYHTQVAKRLNKAPRDSRTIQAIAPDYLDWVTLNQAGRTLEDKKRMV
jgi:hypothetical protein